MDHMHGLKWSYLLLTLTDIHSSIKNTQYKLYLLQKEKKKVGGKLLMHSPFIFVSLLILSFCTDYILVLKDTCHQWLYRLESVDLVIF